MNKLRTIVADDERPAREYLKRLLREFPNVELIGEAENGADAVNLIKRTKPDLALLDLQMPEVSGLEAVKMLRKTQMPLVAFVTAYDEYAVQAFELNAVDYLLKPVEKARLQKTLDRASERLERVDWRGNESDKLKKASEAYTDASRPAYLDRIPVKQREEILLVAVADIASVVADGELLHLTTASNKKYTINFRLKDLEKRLDERQFVRLSRSALVKLDMIGSVSPLPGGTYHIQLKNGQELSSSRIQSKILRSKLFKL